VNQNSTIAEAQTPSPDFTIVRTYKPKEDLTLHQLSPPPLSHTVVTTKRRKRNLWLRTANKGMTFGVMVVTGRCSQRSEMNKASLARPAGEKNPWRDVRFWKGHMFRMTKNFLRRCKRVFEY
jgi:hypothetical protein